MRPSIHLERDRFYDLFGCSEVGHRVDFPAIPIEPGREHRVPGRHQVGVVKEVFGDDFIKFGIVGLPGGLDVTTAPKLPSIGDFGIAQATAIDLVGYGFGVAGV